MEDSSHEQPDQEAPKILTHYSIRPTAVAVSSSSLLTSDWLLVSMRGEELLRISSHQARPRATSARLVRSPTRRSADGSLRISGLDARPPSLRESSTCRRLLADLAY